MSMWVASENLKLDSAKVNEEGHLVFVRFGNLLQQKKCVYLKKKIGWGGGQLDLFSRVSTIVLLFKASSICF